MLKKIPSHRYTYAVKVKVEMVLLEVIKAKGRQEAIDRAIERAKKSKIHKRWCSAIEVRVLP